MSGGCTLARQAIIVGGTSAVPAGVDDELVALGYDEVFRVSGAEPLRHCRSDRRRARHRQLRGRPSTPCTDPVVDDGDARMGFYGNAAVELRNSATTCRVLGRTVVLAEGLTGADALAAGWWTSFWQVPVLLHDGSNTLPAATASALSTLGIDNVIVLGGPARIPGSVLDEVRRLTGADTTRIARQRPVRHQRRDGPTTRRLVADRPGRRVLRLPGLHRRVVGRRDDRPGLARRARRRAVVRGRQRRSCRPRRRPYRALAPLTGEQPGTTSATSRHRPTTPSPSCSSLPAPPRCPVGRDNS